MDKIIELENKIIVLDKQIEVLKNELKEIEYLRSVNIEIINTLNEIIEVLNNDE